MHGIDATENVLQDIRMGKECLDCNEFAVHHRSGAK